MSADDALQAMPKPTLADAAAGRPWLYEHKGRQYVYSRVLDKLVSVDGSMSITKAEFESGLTPGSIVNYR